MKKFLISVLVFVVLLLAMLIGACFFLPGNANRTMLGALPKKYAALDAIQGERIILLGGSGTYMGFDTKYLSEQLKRPVYNLGLHAGLGLVYQMKSAESHFRKGDIVILSPEYSNFDSSSRFGNTEVVAMLAEVMPSDCQLLSFNHWLHLVPFMMEYGGTKIRKLFTAKSKKDNSHDFDLFGDANWPTNKAADAVMVFPLGAKLGASMFDASSLDSIREFVGAVSFRGVKVLIAPPALSDDCFARQKGFVNEIAAQLKSNNVSFVCDPFRLSMSGEYFYDTPYHLNPAGRRERSEIVTKTLKEFMEVE